MKRVYLSGPMTGIPDFNFPAFNAEASRLRALGYDVVNPVDINPDTTTPYNECLRNDLKALLTCDTIAMLPGYGASRGACLELSVARRIGMEVMYLAAQEKEGGLYAIFGPNGRQYIGQAQSFSRRWIEHRRDLRGGKHHCIALQRAWNKHGHDAFRFEPLFLVPQEDRDTTEQHWLDIIGRQKLYNSALNVRSPGAGRKASADTKAKMSAARTGARNHNFGKPLSPETKRKLSDAHLGSGVPHTKPRTAEHKQKLSEALKGKLTGAKNPSARPVVCLDTGDRFDTCSAAADWLRSKGLSKACLSGVRHAACGTAHTAYGYRWSFAEDVHSQSIVEQRLGN